MRNGMWKKGLVFGIIILFLGVGAIPSIMSEETQKNLAMMTIQNTWYVDDSGDNNNGGTSWEDAWHDINYAIDHNSVIDRDTIMVGDGTYNENVMVTKSINLIGEDKNTTIIDANDIGSAIAIFADNVNVKRFTIKNSDVLTWRNSGIEICARFYCNITDNIITNNRNGIHLLAIEQANIFANKLNGNMVGICGHDSSDVKIYRNYFYGNSESAIWLDDSYNITINGNNIEDNNFGISLKHTNENVISENNFIDNVEHTKIRTSELNTWSKNYWDNCPSFSKIKLLLGLWDSFIGWMPYIDWDSSVVHQPYDIK